MLHGGGGAALLSDSNNLPGYASTIPVNEDRIDIRQSDGRPHLLHGRNQSPAIFGGWTIDIDIKRGMDQDDGHEQVHDRGLKDGHQVDRDGRAKELELVDQQQAEASHDSLPQRAAGVVQEDVVQGGPGDLDRFQPVIRRHGRNQLAHD